MHLDLIDIVFVILIFSLSYFWWQGKAIKEKAIFLVKKHCVKMDLQLLDQTVSINKTSIIWCQGNLKIKRTFTFEFTSTGEARYEGKIIFIRNTVESIFLETHKI